MVRSNNFPLRIIRPIVLKLTTLYLGEWGSDDSSRSISWIGTYPELLYCSVTWHVTSIVRSYDKPHFGYLHEVIHLREKNKLLTASSYTNTVNTRCVIPPRY